MRADAPGAAAESEARPRLLPLESSVVRHARGWSVRLPVRAEHINVDKQVVVYERVAVRQGEFEELARVQGSVQREELRVQVEGDPKMSPASERERGAH